MATVFLLCFWKERDLGEINGYSCWGWRGWLSTMHRDFVQVSDTVLHDSSSSLEALYFCAQTLRTKVSIVDVSALESLFPLLAT